ncbi:HAD family hydrolase [Lacibacterium aquatile]|uniref:HAD family hydrolase n=1 Tax=Lacibacterium aquatile TaxID=1168082 RepID=A0ABW5DTH1_9PROT
MTDLVIFDCDGVLVDSEIISCASLAALLTLHGVPTSAGEAMERFLGRSVVAIAEDFETRAGRPLPADFLPTFREDVAARMRVELTAIPDIAKALTYLETAGVPFCLASSSERARIDLSLSVTGIADFFDGRIFNAAMVKHGKPAPDLFLLAAERMGADPSRCLVIEDSVAGVQAGKAAGMTVWGFIGGLHHQGGKGAEVLAAAGADRVFNKMTDFTLHGIEPTDGSQRDREVAP